MSSLFEIGRSRINVLVVCTEVGGTYTSRQWLLVADSIIPGEARGQPLEERMTASRSFT